MIGRAIVEKKPRSSPPASLIRNTLRGADGLHVLGSGELSRRNRHSRGTTWVEIEADSIFTCDVAEYRLSRLKDLKPAKWENGCSLAENRQRGPSFRLRLRSPPNHAKSAHNQPGSRQPFPKITLNKLARSIDRSLERPGHEKPRADLPDRVDQRSTCHPHNPTHRPSLSRCDPIFGSTASCSQPQSLNGSTFDTAEGLEYFGGSAAANNYATVSLANPVRRLIARADSPQPDASSSPLPTAPRRPCSSPIDNDPTMVKTGRTTPTIRRSGLVFSRRRWPSFQPAPR